MTWADASDDVTTKTTSATSATCCAIRVDAMTLSPVVTTAGGLSLPRNSARDLRRNSGDLLFELGRVQSGDLYQLFRAVVPLDQADLVGLDPESLCEQVDDGLVRAPVLRRADDVDGGAVPVDRD